MTELVREKLRRAEEHLLAAGLADLVDCRAGDALETLADLDGPIDLLVLDGWKASYQPVLQLLEGRLAPGAIVVAADLDIMPAMIRPYLDHVRDPAQGCVSVTIPVGDGIELSVRSA